MKLQLLFLSFAALVVNTAYLQADAIRASNDTINQLVATKQIDDGWHYTIKNSTKQKITGFMRLEVAGGVQAPLIIQPNQSIDLYTLRGKDYQFNAAVMEHDITVTKEEFLTGLLDTAESSAGTTSSEILAPKIAMPNTGLVTKAEKSLAQATTAAEQATQSRIAAEKALQAAGTEKMELAKAAQKAQAESLQFASRYENLAQNLTGENATRYAQLANDAQIAARQAELKATGLLNAAKAETVAERTALEAAQVLEATKAQAQATAAKALTAAKELLQIEQKAASETLAVGSKFAELAEMGKAIGEFAGAAIVVTGSILAGVWGSEISPTHITVYWNETTNRARKYTFVLNASSNVGAILTGNHELEFSTNRNNELILKIDGTPLVGANVKIDKATP